MAEPTIREALLKASAATTDDKPTEPVVPAGGTSGEPDVTDTTPDKTTEVVDKGTAGEKLADTAGKLTDDKPVTDGKPADGKPVDKPTHDKPGDVAAAKKDEKKDEVPAGLQPPVSWRAPVREKFWNKLPTDVQVEVLRREKEVQGILKSSGEYKSTHDSVHKLVNDYNDVFSREETPPVQTMANLLNVVRLLQRGDPGQKAQHMATLITTFGVDVAMLDTALSALVQNGVTGKPDQGQALRQMLQTELAPVREFMGSMKQRAEAVQTRSAAQLSEEIEKFANDPANKYFDLVAEDMADLLDLASARGQKLSLPDAYQRAIMTRSDVAGQIAREKLEQAAGQRSAAAAEAKRKADLSTTGAPVAGSLPAGEVPSIREALVAAMSQKT